MDLDVNYCIGGSPYTGNPYVRWERQVTCKRVKKAMPVKPTEQVLGKAQLIGCVESRISEAG